MMRAIAVISFFALLGCSTFGQSTGGAAPPAFDIADVHVSPHTTTPNMRGGVLRAGRYALQTATMVDLIRTAYNVDADKVLSGPSWLEIDRFDVIAKAPPNTSPERLRLMLQTLLADRFKLVVRKDTHPLPAFSLTVGKGGAKLKEADGSEDTGCKFTTPSTQSLIAARLRLRLPPLRLRGLRVADLCSSRPLYTNAKTRPCLHSRMECARCPRRRAISEPAWWWIRPG